MKKILIISLSLLSFFFIGCNECDCDVDEDSSLKKITGTIENIDIIEGSRNIDSVYLIDKEDVVHAKAVIDENNKFNIELPKVLDATVLDDLSLLIPSDFLSDKATKATGMFLCAKKTDMDWYEGMIFHSNIDYRINLDLAAPQYNLYYLLFVDRYVFVEGEHQMSGGGNEIYSMELRKGWNLVYTKSYNNTTEYLTNVAAVSLKWYFLGYVGPCL